MTWVIGIPKLIVVLIGTDLLSNVMKKPIVLTSSTSPKWMWPDTSPPPSIGDLTYLKTFSIHNVRNLTGPIPSTIVKLTNLEFFRISQTNISGPVPEVLSKLKSLTYINLSYNKLVGTISTSTLGVFTIRQEQTYWTNPGVT